MAAIFKWNMARLKLASWCGLASQHSKDSFCLDQALLVLLFRHGIKGNGAPHLKREVTIGLIIKEGPNDHIKVTIPIWGNIACGSRILSSTADFILLYQLHAPDFWSACHAPHRKGIF